MSFDDFNRDLASSLLVSSLQPSVNVLSAESDGVTVSSFSGDDSTPTTPLAMRAFSLKACLTSPHNLEACSLLALRSCLSLASSLAFRALPASNS
jgi:hypothetical protein